MKIESNKDHGTVTFSDTGFHFTVIFNRTIRLPEDGRTHKLPPSLGRFPVHLVDDYKEKVPQDWVEHGGVFFPLHQREALWLGFSGSVGAVKVAAGKINAVSGKPWDPKLAPGNDQTQDYMVAPHPQMWLDGFNSGNGVIKQFVGMALGQGYTVEAQVTGEEKFGGIQLLVVPPKKKIPSIIRTAGGASGQSANSGIDLYSLELSDASESFGPSHCYGSSLGEEVKTSGLIARTASKTLKSAQIGMSAGGSMEQKIYPDPHGIETWNQEKSGRLFVHIINAEMYREITGEYPPEVPISAQQYDGHYFDLNDGHMGDLEAPETLSKVKTVSEMDKQHGFEGQQDDSPTSEDKVTTYDAHPGSVPVRNGKW